MSIISKVKDLGVAIRTGPLQQFLTFSNKEKGGTPPFVEISHWHPPISHQLHN